MDKFYGIVGYGISEERAPGVVSERIVERTYFGDVRRNTRRLRSADKLNDDIVISNEVSIVADPYAYENFHLIRHVEYMGTKWKVTDVEVQYPRLILTMGDVYNG